MQPEATFCEYVPAAQVIQTEDEAAEKVPAVQLVHAALPMVFLYEPALHGVQPPLFCPVNPKLQTQIFDKAIVLTGHTVHEVACVPETEFCGQVLQFSTLKNW